MMKLSDFSFAAPAKNSARPESAGISGSGPQTAGTTQAEQDFVSLEHLFRSIADARPEAQALTGGGLGLTFRELDVLSERIAHFILAQGYGHEAVVGVLCARGAV